MFVCVCVWMCSYALGFLRALSSEGGRGCLCLSDTHTPKGAYLQTVQIYQEDERQKKNNFLSWGPVSLSLSTRAGLEVLVWSLCSPWLPAGGCIVYIHAVPR